LANPEIALEAPALTVFADEFLTLGVAFFFELALVVKATTWDEAALVAVFLVVEAAVATAFFLLEEEEALTTLTTLVLVAFAFAFALDLLEDDLLTAILTAFATGA
jgi:hypothetical protein